MINSEQVNVLLLASLPWLPSFWPRGRESACQRRRHRFDPWVGKKLLEEEIATHSSILAWEISWTEEPGWLQSLGSRKSWTGLKDETTASKTSSLDFSKLESYKCLSLFLFCLKQRKFFFSQFWRLEVQVQGVSRLSFFWGLSSWPVDGRLPSLHMILSP